MSTHRVLISVLPAFGCMFRRLLGAADDGLLLLEHVRPDAGGVQRGLDAQGPRERPASHGELETFGCRVQPCATPGQPTSGIRMGNELLLLLIPHRDDSQQ